MTAITQENGDFVELYGGASRAFGPVTAGLSGAYSPEFFGETGTAFFGPASASAFNAPDATADGARWRTHRPVRARSCGGKLRSTSASRWARPPRTDVRGPG